MVVQAGTVLVFSRGEHSDYRVVAICRALRPFDCWRVLAQVPESVHTCYYDEDNKKYWNPDRFVAWLVTQGYVEHMSGIVEWWQADFGHWPDEVSPMFQCESQQGG
jgi:hypothetical protein